MNAQVFYECTYFDGSQWWNVSFLNSFFICINSIVFSRHVSTGKGDESPMSKRNEFEVIEIGVKVFPAPSEWCPSPAQWRWSMSWRNGCDWWFRQMTVGFFYVVCWNLANTISTREADCTPHSTMSPPWNCSPCNGPAFNTWTTVEVMSFLEKLVSVMS